MTKSKLIEKLINKLTHIPVKVIKKSIKEIFNYMILNLINGERIEIRNFGSFTLHYLQPRFARNPKNGNKIYLTGKYVLHFKYSKELYNRINI